MQTEKGLKITEWRRFHLAEVEDTIPGRFRKMVVAHAERYAVVGRDGALTYAALDQKSDTVANRIASVCGMGSEPVAIVLPQGLAACVASLSVLKAGKFYVPLDPESPREWLRSVVESVDPKLVVTEAKHHALARSVLQARTEVVLIDDDANHSHIDTQQVDAPSSLTPDCTCYVYFTSGTTGAPKGVVDSHRNVLHNVMRYTNSLSISPTDRLSLLQPIDFSGSVSSLFSALLNGACVYPVNLRKENISSVARWFDDNGITIYHSVPSIFRSILDAVDDEVAFPTVRVVRLEGDRASVRDVAEFQRHFKKGALLVNGLGMTEAGIVCQYFVDQRSPTDTDTVPVGFPCDGMDVTIVGPEGTQVADGEVGTIEVTSRFLAQGYWKRPDMTAEVFRSAKTDDGSRVYRTGDLGRVREDGAIEHLGRVDTRVRLDGRWIETTRVEDALARVPGVREAAVTLCRGTNDREYLVGYVCTESNRSPSLHAVRTLLLKTLLPQEVPTRIVKLERLPLTTNGKVDRVALPDPGPNQRELELEAVPPSGMLHRKLVELWEGILKIDGIGIRDDFFDLGGTSMLALQMLGKVESRFGPSLAFRTLVEQPTIEALADAIMSAETGGSGHRSRG